MGKRGRRRARFTEARSREALPGGRTFNDLRELLASAVEAAVGGEGEDRWVWIRDLTDEWVVYELEGSGWPAGSGCFQASYTVADGGQVTLGTPAAVTPQTEYVATATESSAPARPDRLEGRVLEARGADDAGGRIFRVQILEYGTSRNSRRYTESVMRQAVPLYDGARAYDHHRTEAELATSTIQGLIGTYRSVEATTTALEADLHLLPSATHVAEAMDASLAAQAEGLPPLVGVSHDVMAQYRPVVEGGRRLQEATAILAVNSADVVSDPAAGGRATRMVAGGSGTDPNSSNEPEENAMTIEELLALINGATPEQRAAALEGLGITADQLTALAANDPPPPPGDGTPPGDPPPAGTEPTPVAATVGATEAAHARESAMGRLLIRTAVTDAGLDARLVESVSQALPERFTEADIARQVATIQRVTEGLERAGLQPRIQGVPSGDERTKKITALDAMFAGTGGYRSFKEAFLDISGYDPRRIFAIDAEDFNRVVLRESVGAQLYDSARRPAQRSTESIDSTTWDAILGDSITRRMVAEYSRPNLQTWRQIVSNITTVNDFRTQRIDRVGGYGALPAVSQGAPYQPLTSPGDEEATYSLTKRGGTEDLTLEAIANDDLRAIQRIPRSLGLAAAWTVYRFVFDFLASNPTLTYDATALFAAGHANTDAASALAQATLSAGRRKMRKQAAYGDATDVLSIVPRFLVVPSDLEEIAFQLATSAVAIPAGVGTTNDTNVPNIHQGIDPIVVDYWSDTNDWFLVADPGMAPTIEIGFYQGRQDPELFVQDDPKVGSVFTADKVTWKIRHIYSGAWLDHRSAYRGQG